MFWQLCEHKEAQRDLDIDATDNEEHSHRRRTVAKGNAAGPSLAGGLDEEEELQRRRHAKFQKRVDNVQAKKAGAVAAGRPSLNPIHPSPFRVSRTTGRLSHSKPKNSSDRVPTRSRRSGRVSELHLPDSSRTKNKTGLEADSVFSRLWSKLGRTPSTTSSMAPILPEHSRNRADAARRLTAREFESSRVRTGFTTEDVTESPFVERGGTPVEADQPPAYTTDESDSEDEAEDAYYASKRVIAALTHQFRVAVRRQQLSLFLTKDGTLVSIFSKDGAEITPSLIARLRSKGTLLRNSEDASMLLQGIIDACADRALDIMDAFKKKLDMVISGQPTSPLPANLSDHSLKVRLLCLHRSPRSGICMSCLSSCPRCEARLSLYRSKPSLVQRPTINKTHIDSPFTRP